MKKNNIVISNFVSVPNVQQNYSTTEQALLNSNGFPLLWIDGKQIYQKTYNLTNTPFTDAISLDTIVSVFAYADTVDFGICPIVTTALLDGGGAQIQSPITNVAGSLSVNYGAIFLAINSGTLTVQYTKI
jgi:hypothetical protein